MTKKPPSSKLYGPDEIGARLAAELPGSIYRDGHLRRTYQTHGWKGTVMLIGAIGHLAEAAWHHPDILASYASVEVSLKSHDVDGITDRDFELARMIDTVVLWQPQKSGGALPGTPSEDRHAYIRYPS